MNAVSRSDFLRPMPSYGPVMNAPQGHCSYYQLHSHWKMHQPPPPRLHYIPSNGPHSSSPMRTRYACLYVPGNQSHHTYATRVSPSNSADEFEAANALISLPSFRSERAHASPHSAFRPLSKSMSQSLNRSWKGTNRSTIYRPMTVPSSTTPSDMSSFRRQHDLAEQYKSDSGSVSSSSETGISRNDTGLEECWYTGSTSLSLPEDDDVLSALHCFMRRYCVEAFSATEADISTPRYGKSHGGKVVVGQVGIRCLHCRNVPPHKRPERAVCYPSTLRNIYHSVETWQRRHSVLCNEIPGWIKKNLTDLLRSSRSSAGGRRQYWEDSAKKIGLVETPHGIRFAHHPGVEMDLDDIRSTSLPVKTLKNVPLVAFDEKPLVTEYLFLLMEQMQSCQFTEDDRNGGRSKVKGFPVGFPGMQCKHCRGKAGLGRYFPSSVDALALANSDRNIYNHIRKCRRCPPNIQQELRRLRQEHVQVGSKNKRGSRRRFFLNVWERMHEDDDTDVVQGP